MVDAAKEVVREKDVTTNIKVTLKKAIDLLDDALATMKRGRQRLASVEEELYRLVMERST